MFSGSVWPGGKGFGLALSSLIRSSTSGITCDAMRATVAALSSEPSAGGDDAAATADGAVVTGDGVGTGAVLLQADTFPLSDVSPVGRALALSPAFCIATS